MSSWHLVLPSALALSAAAAIAACSSSNSGGASSGGTRDGGTTYPDAGTAPTLACQKGTGTAPVATPKFVMNVQTDTGWFSSPAIVDLSDGKTTTRALVVPSYSIDVFDAKGKTLSHIPSGGATADRIYAPAPIGDFDGDGITDLAVGSSNGTVAMYSWSTSSGFVLKKGWAGASTNSGGDSPETRGMAAADLNGDGIVETVFTTTNTSA